ncbi:MAG: class I SAM-dependent methyltransferase [Deltaproteobacteria bacterium]|nr:class I SAM-dependent methyltransferase [Deltaproteobacteria bacterium]
MRDGPARRIAPKLFGSHGQRPWFQLGMNEELISHTVMQTIACPICHGNNLSKYIDAPNSRISGTSKVDKCNTCGMIFTNPRPDLPATKDNPDPDMEEFAPAFLDRQESNAPFILNLLSKYTTGRRLFDFGCGNGLLVTHAVDAGWDAEGQDIGKSLVAAGNKFFNFNRLSAEPLSSYVPPRIGKFDAIVAWQVFEHVDRPVEIAQQLLPLLASGGIFLIDVPNAHQLQELKTRGSTLHPNSQWNHFTTHTLSALLERIGCKVIYCSGAPALLGLWKKLGAGNSFALAHLAKRILPPIGSGVCAIGRKKG